MDIIGVYGETKLHRSNKLSVSVYRL